MWWLFLCLILAGCASNRDYLIPEDEKNTAQYNLMNSPDGRPDPNLRTKLIRFEY